ncbi:RHS repeat-associated core domain-containing protein, partial [Candidatus Merdisoma sp. JLR.KK006]|uniref:RHS repeat-associated core domain-containing protein n=1 Tax=Candidatus Merdisoma sp. JLR.KK006 TaxID=3112626 RepID=UPI002FEF7641
TLDIYFAEARFYDANNRTWLAMDPIKDGLNWYQYCYSNPTTYYDPLGLWGTVTSTKQALMAGSEIEPALFWRQKDFFYNGWYQKEENFEIAYQMLLKEARYSNFSVVSLAEMFDYFDYFGYENTRLSTLQALVGDIVTGQYYGRELSAVQSILISQKVTHYSDNPKLTQATLEALKDWYDSGNKSVRQFSYLWGNGLGDVVMGAATLGTVALANRPVKTSNTRELYRAVSAEEYEDIMSTGRFRGIEGKTLEAKEFGNNFNETLDFANKSINIDKAAIVRVTIPQDMYDKLNHMNLDPSIFKSGTPVVEPEMLDAFNKSIINIEHVF